MNDDKDLFGKKAPETQCAQCNTILPQKEAVVSTLLIGTTVTQQEHFCCEEHAELYWKAGGWPDDS
jgi:uncharacterized protein with PIN domain